MLGSWAGNQGLVWHLTHLGASRLEVKGDPKASLSEALREAPALAELGLFHNGLSEAGLRVLSEGLASPQCRVQTLR